MAMFGGADLGSTKDVEHGENMATFSAEGCAPWQDEMVSLSRRTDAASPSPGPSVEEDDGEWLV
jgi:hypothetical protein